METEALSTEAMSKKLWKLLKVALLMVKKGFTKSKLIVDATLLLKRSPKLAGKALHPLILSKAQNDAVSISISKDYEFKCDNSPTFPFFHLPKRNKSNLRISDRNLVDDDVTMDSVQRVLEMINVDADELRITDSPFMVKENEEEVVQVNMAADEFINKFYSNLRMEKSTPVDSPYHDMLNS